MIITILHIFILKYSTTGIKTISTKIFGIALLKVLSWSSKIPSTPFVIFFTSWPEFEFIWNLIESFKVCLKKENTLFSTFLWANLSENIDTNKRIAIVVRPTRIQTISVYTSSLYPHVVSPENETRISIICLKKIGSTKMSTAKKKLLHIRATTNFFCWDKSHNTLLIIWNIKFKY